MKKYISLAAGIALVMGFGLAYLAYAEENITMPKDSSDKIDKMLQDGDRMITNDDIQRFDLDPNRSTINQMPEGPGIEGSGAGGVTQEPDKWKTDSAPDTAPSVPR